MALIKCEECDNTVSSKARTCPKCGAPVGASHAAPFGGFDSGITTKPDFWHDPNVGAAGVGILFVLIVIFYLLAR
jgi:endogenous inhibitor of DNA gyrase (YacG/DUF329 family)